MSSKVSAHHLYSSKMLSALNVLRIQEVLTDMLLIANDGHKQRIHSVIWKALVINSKHIESEENNFNQNGNEHCLSLNLSRESLDRFVELMYTGRNMQITANAGNWTDLTNFIKTLDASLLEHILENPSSDTSKPVEDIEEKQGSDEDVNLLDDSKNTTSPNKSLSSEICRNSSESPLPKPQAVFLFHSYAKTNESLEKSQNNSEKHTIISTKNNNDIIPQEISLQADQDTAGTTVMTNKSSAHERNQLVTSTLTFEPGTDLNDSKTTTSGSSSNKTTNHVRWRVRTKLPSRSNSIKRTASIPEQCKEVKCSAIDAKANLKQMLLNKASLNLQGQHQSSLESWKSCAYCSAIHVQLPTKETEGNTPAVGSYKFHHRMCCSKMKCLSCHKPFTNKQRLGQHLCPKSTHICCHLCGKLIRTKGFKLHMKVHLGIKDLTCEVCGKRFRKGCTLSEHRRRMHIEDKPHSCHICGASFALSWDLNRHLHRHRNTTFVCELCGAAFAEKMRWKKHTCTKSINRSENQKDSGREFSAGKRGALTDKEFRIEDNDEDLPGFITDTSDELRRKDNHSKHRIETSNREKGCELLDMVVDSDDDSIMNISNFLPLGDTTDERVKEVLSEIDGLFYNDEAFDRANEVLSEIDGLFYNDLYNV